jgi:alpha-mannosidase
MVSQISLSPGVPRVDIHTTIDNRACDHRLRVHFPTPVRTDCSAAEGTFDVVRRPQGVPANTDDWIEQPVPTHPQKSFVDVSDGKIGLLVANRGLPEFEVLQAPDGSTTIALTLLRCVGWLSRDDFPCRRGHAGPAMETPEAQCLGLARFDYAVVPHAGAWQRAYAQAHAFSAPLRAVSTGLHEGVLPPTQSMIHLEGQNLVLSAVKAAEAGDGLIVRFYNIAEEPTIAHLRVCIPIRSAALVNLAEEQLQDLPVDAQGTVVMQVKGQQIVTVKLKFYHL